MGREICFWMGIFCCLAFSARGENTLLRVTGVKSLFVAVTTPEIDTSRALFRSADSAVVELVVKNTEASRFYCLGVNNRVCFLSLPPGGKVTVEVEKDGFRFSGEGRKRNERLNALSQKIFYSLPNSWVNNYMSELLCPDYVAVDSARLCHPEYARKLKNLFRQGWQEVGHWEEEDPVFIREWQERLQRMYWDALVSTYSTIRYHRWQRPETLLQAIDKMPFRNTTFFQTTTGRVWLYNYLLVQEEMEHFNFTLSDYLLQKACCIPDPDVREAYILRELEREMNNWELLYLREAWNSCSAQMRSVEGKARFRELGEKIERQLKNDTLSGTECDFEFEDRQGGKVSAENLRGKYLYLDFWATWCAPCKQEMPYMQELEKRYGGRNISFVSVSMDRYTDKEKWSAYIQEHQVKGITLIAPQGFKTPFTRKHQVTGIPHFMLIGPDGKMISYHCWRPSDPRMKRLLEQLTVEE